MEVQREGERDFTDSASSLTDVGENSPIYVD